MILKFHFAIHLHNPTLTHKIYKIILKYIHVDLLRYINIFKK